MNETMNIYELVIYIYITLHHVNNKLIYRVYQKKVIELRCAIGRTIFDIQK